MEPGGRPDPVRDGDDEAARLGRALVRCARFGALAVIDPATGAPLASRVALATLIDGTPLSLMSSLAAHSRALAADSRCGLLVGEPGRGDPLAHPRLSLSCRARPILATEEDAKPARARFLRRHPKAKLYADFGDFSLVALEVRTAALNGGFGKAFRLTKDQLMCTPASCAALAGHESELLESVNRRHGDRLGALAAGGSAAARKRWRAVSLDPLGIDLAAGETVTRAEFSSPAQGPMQWSESVDSLLRQNTTR